MSSMKIKDNVAHFCPPLPPPFFLRARYTRMCMHDEKDRMKLPGNENEVVSRCAKAARKCGDLSRAELAQSVGDARAIFESFLCCYRTTCRCHRSRYIRRWLAAAGGFVADKKKLRAESVHDRFGHFSEVNASDP